ncbi:MAG: hypothetical protein HBSAPP03_30140 [Phycisphaerae bacterium]|nr:MAG: hypothetical protein HBSAPP03_30140 [Phycisphaerae bacterium]
MSRNASSSVVRRPSSVVRRLIELIVLSTAMAIMFGAWTPQAGAQWTVTFNVDEQQAATVLGQERVAPMQQALARVKGRLDQILSGSTGSSIITVDWTAPPSGALADATASAFHVATVAVARDKLINKSTEDGEPAGEILMYESLPATAVPFRYDAVTVLSAGFIAIPNSLNKHLAFQPTTELNDGVMRFAPPNATTKWQFWRTNKNLESHEVFEAVAMHEALHLLGFQSSGDSILSPSSLQSWDVFRFGDAAVPVSAAQFTTLARELRPTEEATAVTQLGTANGAYKLSRGKRTGGDGFQASHWRALTRLNPQVAIGVMDPGGSRSIYNSLGRRFITRADVEALDVMGWNVNPGAIQYTAADPVTLVSPAASAQVAAGEPITFEWESGAFLDWDVYIYTGTEIVDDNPVRVFYQLPSTTLTVTLTAENSLPPGEYVWVVVGGTFAGSGISEERRLTILAGCDADVNCDGSVNGADVEVQELAVSGDLTDYCQPDADFNQDGAVNGTDVEAVELVVGGGPCP